MLREYFVEVMIYNIRGLLVLSIVVFLGVKMKRTKRRGAAGGAPVVFVFVKLVYWIIRIFVLEIFFDSKRKRLKT